MNYEDHETEALTRRICLHNNVKTMSSAPAALLRFLFQCVGRWKTVSRKRRRSTSPPTSRAIDCDNTRKATRHALTERDEDVEPGRRKGEKGAETRWRHRDPRRSRLQNLVLHRYRDGSMLRATRRSTRFDIVWCSPRARHPRFKPRVHFVCAPFDFAITIKTNPTKKKKKKNKKTAFCCELDKYQLVIRFKRMIKWTNSSWRARRSKTIFARIQSP